MLLGFMRVVWVRFGVYRVCCMMRFIPFSLAGRNDIFLKSFFEGTKYLVCTCVVIVATSHSDVFCTIVY